MRVPLATPATPLHRPAALIERKPRVESGRLWLIFNDGAKRIVSSKLSR
jgi:hypothetical protein